MGKLQAILFSKKYFNKKTSAKWLSKHRFHPIKDGHVTANFIRWRLLKPNKKQRYAILELDKGILAVYMY